MKTAAIIRTVISLMAAAVLLTGCSGGGGGSSSSGGGGTISYTVTTSAVNGTITPPSTVVSEGARPSFTVTPREGYSIVKIVGCNGSLIDSTYTTSPITANCLITASFASTPATLYNVGVSVLPAGSGTVDGGGTYSTSSSSTSTATVTATPKSGYRFLNWTLNGTDVSTKVNYSFNVTDNINLVANFVPDTHVVDALAGPGGSIAPASQDVAHGKTASFSVVPNSGYSISSVFGCNGSLSGTTYTTSVINGNCVVTATFAAGATTLYTIKADTTPNVGGSVSGGGSYGSGRPVTLIADANTGYTFTNWTENGSEVSTAASYTFNATANRTLVANFTADVHVVTGTSGTSGGSITPDTQDITHGLMATFTVTPDTGYYIAGVSGCNGALSGTTYTTGAVTADCTVTASYSSSEVTLYTVAASASPDGGGTVDGGGVYAEGKYAYLDAVANKGYRFSHWVVDGVVSSDQDGSTWFRVTQNSSVVAVFLPGINIRGVAGTTGGTITPASQDVEYGGYAKFTITPDLGYVASQVIDNCGSTAEVKQSGNTYVVGPLYGGSRRCELDVYFKGQTGVYAEVPYGGGTISPSGFFYVTPGYTQSFTVTPDSGYYISRVEGCYNGSLTGNVYTTGVFTSNYSCRVQAYFSKTQQTLYTVTVGVSPAGAGAVGGGGTFYSGFAETVSAEPSKFDYAFKDWTENGVVVSTDPNYSFTLTSNRNLVANFVPLASAVKRVVTVTSPEAHGKVGYLDPFNIAYVVGSTFIVPDGLEQRFDIVPDANYKVKSVSGCGDSLNPWMTGPVTYAPVVSADCTITVTYERIYWVGGEISGLGSSPVVLQHTGTYGSDPFYTQTLAANGTFTFTPQVTAGTYYNFSIKTQPADRYCTLTKGTGYVNSDVTNINVTCSLFVGGKVTGLATGSSLVLKNGLFNTLTISANGSFQFPNVTDGSSYNIEVATQPANPAQTCTVTNGTGSVSGTSVTNVEVHCPPPWKKVSTSRSSLDTEGHTLAIKADGTLWAWGQNASGQLGDNTNTSKLSPIQIGTTADWVDVAAGHNHSLAVKSDGTLWAWGLNSSYQLGTGTTTSQKIPTKIGTALDWSRVTAGENHSVGLKTDGRVLFWGFGTKTTPTTISVYGAVYSTIASGSNHVVAVKSDGTLWGYGNNSAGQLGDGTLTNKTTMIQIGTAADWSKVAAGKLHTVATKTDGTLYSWGDNAYGQLGDGTSVDKLTPALATTGIWTSIGAGENHTVAVNSDGTLWAWGRNANGELGDGTATDKWSPTQIGTDTNWSSTAPGGKSSYALKTDGSLWASGDNYYGELGIGTSVPSEDRLSPTEVDTASWLQVAAGTNHTVAIKADGTLWAWGLNDAGQLGDNTTTARSKPTQIGSDANWASVAVGTDHSVAIKTDGTLWAWGSNSSYKLGDGTTATNRLSPTPIGADTNWASVTAGSEHTLAIKTNGTLWAWGSDLHGQLGETDIYASVYSPAQVGSGTTWLRVAAGGYHSVALKTDGTLWAWGYSSYGQVGSGNTFDHTSSTQIGSATNWASIAAGSNHTVAVMTNGTMYAWGRNNNGQVDGTGTNKLVPTLASGTTDWSSVAAGGDRTLALKTTGTLWAWGLNSYGQLGDGTATTRTAPVQIGTATWTSIAAGGSHSMGINSSGLSAWGYNYNGQLGTGSSGREQLNRLTPVSIAY